MLSTFVHDCGLSVKLGKLPLYSWFSKDSGPANPARFNRVSINKKDDNHV